jgi:hypothetical protein
MKFTLTFEISPPGLFGLPEKETTVIPSAPGGWHGDVFHTPSMRAGRFVKAGHGTLSKYREDSERISAPISLGNIKGHITDNFVFLEVQANNHCDALRFAWEDLTVFLQHLSVNAETLFKAAPLIIETDDGCVYPIPTQMRMGLFKVYNLEKLKENISTAQQFSRLNDARLRKALNYYEHALWLYEHATKLENITSRHYPYLISMVFLNLWKCITAIVGDPARKKDRYLKRYSEIGLKQQDKANIDQLKKLRNDCDVAHYALTQESFKEVQKKFGTGLKTAAEVIRVYREHLLGGEFDEKNSGTKAVSG